VRTNYKIKTDQQHRRSRLSPAVEQIYNGEH